MPRPKSIPPKPNGRPAGRPMKRLRVTEEQDHEAQRDHERHERQVSARRLAVVEAALADGRSPLHVMLANMSYFQEKAERQHNLLSALTKEEQARPENRAELKASEENRVTASTLAKEAAPYIHPRLAAIDVSGAEGQGGGMDILLAMPAGERQRRIAAAMERLAHVFPSAARGPVIDMRPAWKPPADEAAD